MSCLLRLRPRFFAVFVSFEVTRVVKGGVLSYCGLVLFVASLLIAFGWPLSARRGDIMGFRLAAEFCCFEVRW